MSVVRREYSSRDFAHWRAYDAISPAYPERGDYHAALVARTVAETHRTSGVPYKLEDFLLRFDGKQQRQQMSMKDMKAVARQALLGAAGRKGKKKGRK